MQSGESPYRTIVGGINLPDYVRGFMELRRSGDHFIGVCPFHPDKSPSLHVFDDHYHCFSCNAHGSIIDFEIHRGASGPREAAERLAERYQLPVEFRALTNEDREILESRRRLETLHEQVAEHYRELLWEPVGQIAREYLNRRGFSDEAMRTWGLGYAPEGSTLVARATDLSWARADLETLRLIRKRDREDSWYDFFRDRIIIPIRDARGRCIAFGARAFRETSGDRSIPKYLNSSETPLYSKSRVLFNLDRARATALRAREVIIVEGYMDCMALANAGVENVVAVLGTALTSRHVQELARFVTRAVLCFDSDDAGQSAAARSFEVGYPENLLEFRTISVDDGKDPDDYIRKHGADRFRALIRQAQPLLHFVAERVLKKEGTLEGCLRAIQSDVLPIIRRNPDPAQQELAFSYLAQRLGLSSSLVLRGGGGSVGERSAIGTQIAGNVRKIDNNVLPAPSTGLEAVDEQISFWRVSSAETLKFMVGLVQAERTEIPEALLEDSGRAMDNGTQSWREEGEPKLGRLIDFCLETLDRLGGERIINARTCDLQGLPETLRCLLVLVRRDVEGLEEVGLRNWVVVRDVLNPRFVPEVSVFSSANMQFVNFVLDDVELSIRQRCLDRYLAWTFSELCRKFCWAQRWSKLRRS